MSEGEKLVPKLRFPEFRSASGWKFVPLNRLATRGKQRNRDEGIDHVLTNSAEFGVINQRDYFDKDIATQGKLESYYVVELGDYVYNPRISATAPVGPISKNNIAKGVMSPLYTVFRFKDPKNDFYHHYFKTTGWHAYMRQISSTGARHDRMAIGSDDFMAMPLPISSPREQQKVADCLSSVDELIAAQAHKLDALKSHKEGLMQQLFPPRAGETQPRLRFTDFQGTGNWVHGDLGLKATKIGSGITPAGGGTNYKQSGRPFVRSQNVGWGELLLKDVAFIDEKVHSSFSATEIKTFDVLLNITGASIGRCAVADERIAGGNVNQHVCIIRVKPAELSPFFISQYLISPFGQSQIDSFQAGGNRQGLNFAQMRSFLIPLPPTIPEQQCIADCLTSLDKLIITATQELATLKAYKNGLMQQLFPAAEAAEGMSNKPKIHGYTDMRRLVTRLRDDLNGGNQDFVLLYAYNGTGKTRLSMEFKDAGKRKNRGKPDTLYFNAYTEDLFSWDNDLDKDSERRLHINTDSTFFKGLKELALDERIGFYLGRYTDFLFDIDYDQWTISFRKSDDARHIKVSRGEENIFIWCVFMAICERVIDGAESYQWVKYLYIDDPITSLDDNNAIAVASDLAKLLRKAKGRTRAEAVAADGPGAADNPPRMVPAPIKAVVSSHHALFFNVVCNELKKDAHKKYFLHRPERGSTYTLRATDDTPFFHHVAMLAEIKKAAEGGKLYTYQFNMLRSILEKTATFFGNDDFSACIHGLDDEDLFARALNLLSHGKYDIYQPAEMVDDNKRLFRQILDAFLGRYQFALPDIFGKPGKNASGAATR